MQNAGVYIHIPFCRHKCGYCSFCSTADFSFINSYVDALCSEIKSRSTVKLDFDSIYFGGGTPSVLPSGAISKIMQTLKSNYNILSDCEITLEANPESATKEFFDECRQASVNRVSIGMQSTFDEILKKIGRIHSFTQFLQAVQNAQEAGITNINADLMLGLPSQSMAKLYKDVSLITALPLTHISIYPLAIEEGTAMYEAGVAVDEDLQADMYEYCLKEFTKANFNRYEVSNFAKDGYKSRHNLKYWTMAPYFGFGLAAHSFSGTSRSSNTEKMLDYLQNRPLALSTDENKKSLIEQYIMLSLRTSEGINTHFLKSEYNYDIFACKSGQINELLDTGMIHIKNGQIALDDGAYYIMNSVIIKLIDC